MAKSGWAEALRPGFCRVSLPFFSPQEEIAYVAGALRAVAASGWRVLPQYRINRATGEWAHASRATRFPDRVWLAQLGWPVRPASDSRTVPYGDRGGDERGAEGSGPPNAAALQRCLEEGMAILEAAGQERSRWDLAGQCEPVELEDPDKSADRDLRWFVLPAEAAAALNTASTTGAEGGSLGLPAHGGSTRELGGHRDCVVDPARYTAALAALGAVPDLAGRWSEKTPCQELDGAGPQPWTPPGAQPCTSPGATTETDGAWMLRVSDVATAAGQRRGAGAAVVKEKYPLRQSAGGLPGVGAAYADIAAIAALQPTGLPELHLHSSSSPPFASDSVPCESSPTCDAFCDADAGAAAAAAPQLSCAPGLACALRRVPGILSPSPLIAPLRLVAPPGKIMRAMALAIAEWSMIVPGDSLLLGLSGGKDSLALLHCLVALQAPPQAAPPSQSRPTCPSCMIVRFRLSCPQRRSPVRFELAVATVDPGTESFNPRPLIPYVESLGLRYHYLENRIFDAATEAMEGDSICSFCSRIKRGALYRYHSGLRHNCSLRPSMLNSLD